MMLLRVRVRTLVFFVLMMQRPPKSTLSSSSAASDVYKRQVPGSAPRQRTSGLEVYVKCSGSWVKGSTSDGVDLVVAEARATRDNGQLVLTMAVMVSDSYTRSGVFHPEHASISPAGIAWLRRGACMEKDGTRRPVTAVHTTDGCDGDCGFFFVALVECTLRYSPDKGSMSVLFGLPNQDKSEAVSVSLSLCRQQPATEPLGLCTNALFAPLEPRKLLRWIQYHQRVGVTKFYVYDRDGSYAHALLSFGALVEHIDWPAFDPEYFASHAYFDQILINQACLLRNGLATRWLGFTDVDEYVHPAASYRHAYGVATLLSQVPAQYSWIKLQSQPFARLPHASACTLRAPRTEYDINRFKSIVDGSRVHFLNVHTALAAHGAGYEAGLSELRLNHCYQSAGASKEEQERAGLVEDDSAAWVMQGAV
eukprot:TRINITY_DN13696_c0_g1_i1.p1 TRINITY_DN13696_c0_g1~~TRINITY_DN13696_c0_g1_i1.p1  ORF type:complete len:423 (-),score=93.64 TRINITY_DN13696_c0_g1_i1:44-1312(-)